VRTFKLTLVAGLLAAGLLAGCGEGHQGNSDGSLDGDVNPDGLLKLEFLTRSTHDEFLADVTLSEDETEVVACSMGGEVILYDAETLMEKARVTLGEDPDRPDGYCRIKRIGGKVYAYYGNSHFPSASPSRMIMGKVDLATRGLDALWEFPSYRDPDSPYNENTYDLAGRNFSGLEPLGEGSLAVFALGVGKGYSQAESATSGIDVPFLNLETGELTVERRVDIPGMYGAVVHFAFDGHRILTGYRRTDGTSPNHVMLDLDTNQVTELEQDTDPLDWVEIDEELRALTGGGGLSDGWWVRDLDSWAYLGQDGNLHSAWCEDGTLLSRTRIALAYSFNDPPAILAVVDMSSGEGLASAWIDEESLEAVVSTRDHRRIFVGGIDTLSRVEIPDSLVQ